MAARSPLCRRGVVARLLAAGADVNAVSRTSGHTPAMYALVTGQLEALRMLVDHDARARASGVPPGGAGAIDWRVAPSAPRASGLLAFALLPAPRVRFIFHRLSRVSVF